MTANTPTDPQLQRKAAAPTRDEPAGSWARAAATSWRANLASSLSPRNIGAVYVLIVICIVFSIWAP